MTIGLTKPMLLNIANIGDWVMHADLEGYERDDPEVEAQKSAAKGFSPPRG